MYIYSWKYVGYSKVKHTYIQNKFIAFSIFHFISFTWRYIFSFSHFPSIRLCSTFLFSIIEFLFEHISINANVFFFAAYLCVCMHVCILCVLFWPFAVQNFLLFLCSCCYGMRFYCLRNNDVTSLLRLGHFRIYFRLKLPFSKILPINEIRMSEYYVTFAYEYYCSFLFYLEMTVVLKWLILL